MQFNNLLLSIEKNVAIISINRPNALNALNKNVLEELYFVFKGFVQDKGIKAVVLTGVGDKSFIAGADIKEMSELNSVEARLFSDLGHLVTSQIESLDIPVIAAVNGYALGGGCEIALACDIIYASKNAKMGQPEVNLGLIPGFGGCERLQRLVGKMRAKELIFTGNIINAQRAYEIGLVAEVFEPEDLLEKAKEVAFIISKKSPLAIMQAKRAIEYGADCDLKVANELEKHSFSFMFGTNDAKEGMKAFIEKRKPDFKGD